jgi:hypothetical protein
MMSIASPRGMPYAMRAETCHGDHAIDAHSTAIVETTEAASVVCGRLFSSSSSEDHLSEQYPGVYTSNEPSETQSQIYASPPTSPSLTGDTLYQCAQQTGLSPGCHSYSSEYELSNDDYQWSENRHRSDQTIPRLRLHEDNISQLTQGCNEFERDSVDSQVHRQLFEEFEYWKRRNSGL